MIDNLLSFSKKERWGIFVLCTICLLAWFIPSFLSTPSIQSDDLEVQMIDLEMKRNKIILIHKPFRESSYQKYWMMKHPTSVNTRAAVLFDFDPNQISKDEWIKLGFQERMANSIVKYVEKGGRFRKKEDLKKIYGMTEDLYEKLEPHILFVRSEINSSMDHKKMQLSSQMDLNTADNMELISLPGIGEKLSSRIIKFRNKLGGFVDIAQLKEVYGIDTAVYSSLLASFHLRNPLAVKRININEVLLEELKKHPYAGYVNAKLIIAYRTAHGKIENKDELLSISEIEKNKIEKLLPYLIF